VFLAEQLSLWLRRPCSILHRAPRNTLSTFRDCRQDSGSAFHSLFGSYIAWEIGSAPDGSDSHAIEVAPREHWPDIHALICVVDDKKGTSSTSGMQRTVKTSPLLQHRIAQVVPACMSAIKDANLRRDFPTFACITMQDSNQFQAIALGTNPQSSILTTSIAP
jgi:diphosphomevalonate decarboxylase